MLTIVAGFGAICHTTSENPEIIIGAIVFQVMQHSSLQTDRRKVGTLAMTTPHTALQQQAQKQLAAFKTLFKIINAFCHL